MLPWSPRITGNLFRSGRSLFCRLEDQIEQLEDKLFDAEEEVMSLQRKLVLVVFTLCFS
jgi:hypothetical protein